MRRISFIEARSPGAHIFSKFPIPRLGSVLLATMLKQRGYDVRVFIEDIAEPDWSYVESSDLVCISTITSTAIRAYHIADMLRKKGMPVIMGGAHPTFMAEEALEHADFVVRGEGDISLPSLVESLSKGKPDITQIEGISYREKSGHIRHNPPGKLLEDLDILPNPDFSLVHQWTSKNIYPISTSRGCPYNCKFCSVIQIFGRKYRYRSVEATLKDLKEASVLNNRTKFIVDDNFAANKTRTKQILRGMIEEGIKTSWSAQVRTEVAKDPELLQLMADAGCDTLYIGFESINPKTLAAYNKKQDVKGIVDCIRKVKEHGIHIHGMFVLGADTDDKTTIKETADFAIKLGIDTVQFVILTPLPGTPFFEEMKRDGRLLHTDWSKYDAHHVVFKPNLIDPVTLQIETIKAMGKFYSWKYILKHLVKFEFFYAAIGLYGKKSIKKGLKEIMNYIESFGIDSIIPERKSISLSR
jgi:radical SAM superfamily enzyme YgiQ (UPF0313 family)